MATKETDKLDIADEMLDAAIIEFLDNKNYFASFNLAGVAEEIYGKYLRLQNKQESMRDTIDFAQEMYKRETGEGLKIKDWKKIATKAKNSIKHFDTVSDRYIKIDAKDEAKLMIHDAITNNNRADRKYTLNMTRFDQYGHKLEKYNA